MSTNATNTNPQNTSVSAALQTTFIFQVTGPRTLTSLDSLSLDAAPRVTHTSDVDVTEHPVETGSNVSDNARARPDQITVDGFVSEAPLPGNISTQSGLPVGQGRAKTAFDTLRQLKDNGTVITVSTALHTYPNMVIEHLEATEDAATGQSLRVTVGLKAVRVVSSQTIAPPAARLGANKKSAVGTQPTTPAPTQLKSFLYSQTNSDANPVAPGFQGHLKAASSWYQSQ